MTFIYVPCYGMNYAIKEFWAKNPETKILLLSHSISRMLTLASNRNRILLSGSYLRLIAYRLRKLLKYHIRITQYTQ